MPPIAPVGERAPLMLDVDQARARILAAFAPLATVRLPLAEALGLAPAADVIADAELPPFANAAMDGFAVRGGDTVTATPDRPVPLAVIGEAAAGHPAAVSVGAGQAVRIMTGAPLPAGADAVVRFEDTDEAASPEARRGTGRTVGIVRAAPPGHHVRPAGEEVRGGEVVVPGGVCLRPAAIGLLAALGQTHVSVCRRPRVAILATGDELAEPGQAAAGQIWNSNTPMLAAMVRHSGGEPHPLGVARDSMADLHAKLAAARGLDLLLTTGGVSAGDYDMVKHALRMAGRIDLWQVRMKPGRPLAFGELEGVPLLGLPGTPAAAAVAFAQFARPAIRTMLGCSEVERPSIWARLASSVENSGGRRQFVPVWVETSAAGVVAHLAGPGRAGSLAGLARANGLLIVPEPVTIAEAGELFQVQLLDGDA